MNFELFGPLMNKIDYEYKYWDTIRDNEVYSYILSRTLDNIEQEYSHNMNEFKVPSLLASDIMNDFTLFNLAKVILVTRKYILNNIVETLYPEKDKYLKAFEIPQMDINDKDVEIYDKYNLQDIRLMTK